MSFNLAIFTCGCGKEIKIAYSNSAKNHTEIYDIEDQVFGHIDFADDLARYHCKECRDIALELRDTLHQTYLSELSLAFRDHQVGKRREREQK